MEVAAIPRAVRGRLHGKSAAALVRAVSTLPARVRSPSVVHEAAGDRANAAIEIDDTGILRAPRAKGAEEDIEGDGTGGEATPPVSKAKTKKTNYAKRKKRRKRRTAEGKQKEATRM